MPQESSPPFGSLQVLRWVRQVPCPQGRDEAEKTLRLVAELDFVAQVPLSGWLVIGLVYRAIVVMAMLSCY